MQRKAPEIEKNATLKVESDDAHRRSQEIISSNTGSANRRCSSNQENNRSTCKSNVTNRQNSDQRQDKWINIFLLQQILIFCLLVTKTTAQTKWEDGSIASRKFVKILVSARTTLIGRSTNTETQQV